MAWLVPVVIIKAHAISFVFPAACNIELLVEQQEAPRAFTLAIAKHGDHNIAIGKAVDGVRSCQVRLCLDLFWFDDFVQPWCTFIRGVKNVDTAGDYTRKHKEPAGFTFVIVA